MIRGQWGPVSRPEGAWSGCGARSACPRAAQQREVGVGLTVRLAPATSRVTAEAGLAPCLCGMRRLSVWVGVPLVVVGSAAQVGLGR